MLAGFFAHLHLHALAEDVNVSCNAAVEDKGDLLVVMAKLPRVEVDRYLHHTTRGNNIWLEVDFEESVFLELALDTEEGKRGLTLCCLFNHCLLKIKQVFICAHLALLCTRIKQHKQPAPDALCPSVAHHQGLAGGHHAGAVQEALAKVELGEGELQARFYSCALNHKDERWSKFHLKGE